MAEIIIKNNQNTTKLINELKKSSKQYKCLSKTEERELIETYRNDRDKLNHLLFMHNIRTVFNIAKSYISKTNDFDSLVQNGMVGLSVACQRFDLDRDIKFCTYATNWVRKYMTMQYYTSQFKLDLNTISMNTPGLFVDQSDSNITPDETFENCMDKYLDPTINNIIKPIDNQISADEQIDLCKHLYTEVNNDTSLSATDKKVFMEIFVDRDKTREIAERHNIEMSDVSEIKYRVLGKLKKVLISKYGISKFSDISV